MARTKAEGEVIRAELLAMREGKKGDLTFSQYAEKWLNRVKSKNRKQTAISYERWIGYCCEAIGHIQLTQLKRSHCSEIRDLQANRHPEYTIEKSIKIAKTMLNEAVEDGTLEINPWLGVRSKPLETKKIEIFTVEEEEKILTKAGDLTEWIQFLFASGVRIGESVSLQWKDVSKDFGQVDIKSTESKDGVRATPKTPTSIRKIPLPEFGKAALKKEFAKGKREEFVFRFSPKANSNAYRAKWKKVVESCGVKYRKIHTTRHTYASRLLSRGVPITTVSALLGHSSPQITLSTYAHLIEDNLSKAVKALESFGE